MNNRLIDFHSHILPGADHGSRDIDMSLKQLALIKKEPVDKIVATPHFYPHADSLKTFLKRREKSVSILKRVVDFDIPEIYIGAEVLLCPGLESMAGLESLCISGTNTLLIEMPFTSWNSMLMDTVENLLFDNSFNVVFAHIDRYVDKIDQLAHLNYKAQINVESFKSFFKRKKIIKAVPFQNIVAVGSDLHGMNNGYGYFTKCCSYVENIEKITEASEKLLCGAVPINEL